ncbi:hypothetical protein ARMSODRAFT_983588 [Armillaria solidipes]|uniref:Uncharacterized protein n=1 Tax=Armillaria solidipes TaxID=1076256 RepID=A0A2H3AIF8_9AGAR|nr:hypothetical protein ARMSODRAFT_983588 [Armillaria solidipes]
MTVLKAELCPTCPGGASSCLGLGPEFLFDDEAVNFQKVEELAMNLSNADVACRALEEQGPIPVTFSNKPTFIITDAGLNNREWAPLKESWMCSYFPNMKAAGKFDAGDGYKSKDE